MRTKFYTGKGDKGSVKFGNKEISKDDILFDVLGGIDDLNAWVGFCRVETDKLDLEKIKVTSVLRKIQEHLFIAQAETAAIGFEIKSKIKINKAKIVYLENNIKKIDKILPKLEDFVIPGGSEVSARLEVARTKAREVERRLVQFSDSPSLLKYFNRLSSFFFALSRYVNHELGIKEDNPEYK